MAEEIFYNIDKAYESGIDYLTMGGEFDGNGFFREKDVMVNDYSEPVLYGKCQVVDKKVFSSKLVGDLFCVNLRTDDGHEGQLLLTKDEYEAGLEADV